MTSEKYCDHKKPIQSNCRDCAIDFAAGEVEYVDAHGGQEIEIPFDAGAKWQRQEPCATCQEHLKTIDELQEKLTLSECARDFCIGNTDYAVMQRAMDAANEKQRRRDLFAAAALTGCYSNPSFYNGDSDGCRIAYVGQALAIADAMLKAMEEPNVK